MSEPINPNKALSFFHVVGKLKTLKRTGWVNNKYTVDINLPESVADHMYRMTMLSWIITDQSINKEKLMKICLVHDLAESIVGDITPHDGITKEEKRQLEENALKSIVNDLDNIEISNEIFNLWLEYENSSSQEAVIAKQLDKLEMIIQADEYEEETNKLLQSFFDSTANSFVHPEIVSWANQLRLNRNNRLNKTI